MKNFLEITAIDTANQLAIEIELIEHHDAQFLFFVNETKLDKCRQIVYQDLMQPIKFVCQTNTGAIQIAKLFINGHEVLPRYQHHASPPTNWITGSWKLEIPGPFYPWYHQITGQGWIA